MSDRIPVTILGATGVVGQRFVERLAGHPQFRIQHLAASERSAGQAFSEVASWRLGGEAYAGHGDSRVGTCDPADTFSPVVFSALTSEAATEIEPSFAEAGAIVFSNASTYRMAPDVPLMLAEVNPDHLDLLTFQRRTRGWSGGIVCNPNCTAAVLVMGLAPLQEAFGIDSVLMTSMQAVSGAGYPGVASLDILGNVVPFVGGEEEKVAEETPRMLGTYREGSVTPADMAVSAHCNRVPVLDGHLESVSVALRGDPGVDEVRAALREWNPEPQRRGLHSAPLPPLRVHEAEDRPQTRIDVDRDGGMSVHVGRIRRCTLLGIKFTLLGHNTHRGAAGGSVLNAELALARGAISG